MSGVSMSGATAPTQGQATVTAPATQQTTTTTTTTPPATAPTAPTTQSGDTPWYSTISDAALQEYAKGKGWKGMDAALTSYRELETKLSQRAAPADPKDYVFEKPVLKDGMSYSDDFAVAFRAMAHKAGLSAEQAKAVHDGYVEYASTQHTAGTEASARETADRVAKAAAGLEAAFQAKQGSPEFGRQLEMAKRAIRMLDPKLMDELRSTGVVAKAADGQDMIANAGIIAVLAKVGQAMYAEDHLYGQPPEGVNPFDPKTADMSAQGYLVKNDPERAKLLIRALPKEAQRMWTDFLNK